MKLSDIEDNKLPRTVLSRYMDVLGLNNKSLARILGCSDAMAGHYCRGDCRIPAGAISTLRLLVYMRELGILNKGLKIVHGLGDFEVTDVRNFI